MKDQRLVNTFLTGGAEEDESPRVRNLFLCTPVLSGIRRYSLNNVYKMKTLKHRIKSLCDNKLADIVLGLFSPFRFGITEYFGYDITVLRDHIRFLEVIVNRNGEMGGLLPLWFDGAVCDFKELPKPEDKVKIADIYNMCKTLATTGKYPVTTVKAPNTAHTLMLSMKNNIRHIININNF